MVLTVFNKSRWKWEGAIFLLIWISDLANSQVFIQDCADPILLENHMDRTYCAHACGYDALNLPDTSTCTAAGNCICNFPCEALDTPPSGLPDICPAAASDPPDPDPNQPQTCDDACQATCPGGGSVICGNNIPQGPGGMTFTKICTCYCMPMPCTTTTPAPTTTPSAIALPGSNNLLPNIVALIAGSLAFTGVNGSLIKIVLKAVFVLGGLFIKYQFGDLFGLMRSGVGNLVGEDFNVDNESK